MTERDELLRRAREVRRNAHAPYSSFHVGAALVADDGSVHVGCNVENASYGLTVCAERNALAAAVAAGHRSFRGLALSTAADGPVPPCGACRQVLAEFEPGLPVISQGAGGEVGEWNLDELLPAPFLSVPETAEGPGLEVHDTDGSSRRKDTTP